MGYKYFGKLLIALLFVVFLPFPIYAQQFLNSSFLDTENAAVGAGYSATSYDDAQADLIDTIVNYVYIALGFAGTIIVIIILYAGWLYMVSQGNQEKISESLKWLKNGAIGLIIIMSAYALTAFVLRSILESVMSQ